jgi:hypothetical protein
MPDVTLRYIFFFLLNFIIKQEKKEFYYNKQLILSVNVSWSLIIHKDNQWLEYGMNIP